MKEGHIMTVLVFVVVFIIVCIFGHNCLALLYKQKEDIKSGKIGMMDGNTPLIWAGVLFLYPCAAAMITCKICGMGFNSDRGIIATSVFYMLYSFVVLVPWVLFKPACFHVLKYVEACFWKNNKN